MRIERSAATETGMVGERMVANMVVRVVFWGECCFLVLSGMENGVDDEEQEELWCDIEGE